jgi:hypothetical protein
LDRRWRLENKYGKKAAEEAKQLIDRRPVQITECLLTPETYLKSFKVRKKRR